MCRKMLSFGAPSLRGGVRRFWLVPLVQPLACRLCGARARSWQHPEPVPAIGGADPSSTCSARKSDGRASTIPTAACCASRPCSQARLGNRTARPERLSSLTSFATGADQLLVLSAGWLARSHDALFADAPLAFARCEDGIARHCRVPPGAGEIQTAFEIVFETFAIHDV